MSSTLPPSPGSSSSTPTATAFIAWLPCEVLGHIFAYIHQPIDLYNSSLVCRIWRAAAVDPRLWEAFYWRFYRGGGTSKQAEILAQRRDEYRRGCMRAWLKDVVASSLPTDFFRSFLTRHPASGALIIYEPLQAVEFAFIEMLGDDQTEEVLFHAMSFAMKEWSDLRPVNPEEGTRMISDHLKKVFGRGPTPKQLLFAKMKSLSVTRSLEQPRQVEAPEASLPHFLDAHVAGKSPRSHRRRRQPNFCHLFASRMNKDEALLGSLQEQTCAASGKLDKILRLIDRHGDDARDLLFALIATQEIASQSVSVFATEHDSQEGAKPRALSVHSAAAAGSASQLSRFNCLALYNAAQQMLGHLQRREAVRSLQCIRDRWLPRQAAASQTLRERVLDSCAGIEDALGTMALFRFGEKSEISAHLDDLALHVFANLETARCSLETMRREHPLPSSAPSLPHGNDPAAPRTTRRMIEEIHRILDNMGFGIDHGADFNDINKLFIHVPLWCPERRHSHPFIQTAIFCAVARRLGVAASLIEAPHSVMAVVVRDDAHMRSSPSDGAPQHGNRFYYTPGNDLSCLLLEYDEARQWMIHYGEPHADNVEPFLEPASPLFVLQRVGHFLHHVRERERDAQPVDLEVVGERVIRSDVDEVHSSGPQAHAAKDDLGALLAYLTGHQPSPPWPLVHGALPSSLAMLPRGAHGSTLALSKDSECAFFWLFRVVDPSVVHGLQRADDMYARSFWMQEIGHDNYCCDVALVLGINGCNVAQELALARDPKGKVDEKDGKRGSYYDDWSSAPCGHSSHSQLRAIAAAILNRDLRAGTGMGGAGGSDPHEAHAQNPEVRPLLNRAHPSNSNVKYGVGAIMEHRSRAIMPP